MTNTSTKELVNLDNLDNLLNASEQTLTNLLESKNHLSISINKEKHNYQIIRDPQALTLHIQQMAMYNANQGSGIYKS